MTQLKPGELLNRPVKDERTGLWKIPRRGQGRAIRDEGLCKEIIACLKGHNIDPTKFTDKDIKTLTDPNDWKLRTRSGVPIFTVTVLLTLSDPISIVGKDGVERFYVGGNNHHMEILESEESGKWLGHCWG